MLTRTFIARNVPRTYDIRRRFVLVDLIVQIHPDSSDGARVLRRARALKIFDADGRLRTELPVRTMQVGQV